MDSEQLKALRREQQDRERSSEKWGYAALFCFGCIIWTAGIAWPLLPLLCLVGAAFCFGMFWSKS